jgi:glycosyltransferase involved in cell wall biosynthesis
MLSIIMPVYNESATVVTAVERVLSVDYPCPVELIVVDDGSVDATPRLLADVRRPGVHVVRHERNQGKGAAVRTGVNRAAGTHMIIMDADLEYSPGDIVAMLLPVAEGRSDHVFGTRVFGMNTLFPSFRFAMGGRLLTLAANALYDSCLTDLHTCLKLVPVRDFRTLSLSENGFGLDTELTARLLRAGVRPFEVPVTYHGRPFDEGKKISWRDGLQCLRILARVRLQRATALDRVRPPAASEAIPVAVPTSWSGVRPPDGAGAPRRIDLTAHEHGIGDDAGVNPPPAVAL